MPKTTKAKPRGFAAMDPEKQREIARRGGQSVPAEKRSFAQNRALAAAAGQRGGLAVSDEARSFSKDRALASKAGTKGGKSGIGAVKSRG